jgi:hypothetical protein
MRRISFVLAAVIALAGVVAHMAPAAEGAAAPIFGITIPPGYRDWKQSFPDGTVIARLAWNYVPSAENNKVFGRDQSFVAGSAPDWYLQFMVKDSKRYAATGGWGYAQFDKNGNPADEAKHGTCFPCHAPAKDRDYVFTRYAP